MKSEIILLISDIDSLIQDYKAGIYDEKEFLDWLSEKVEKAREEICKEVEEK